MTYYVFRRGKVQKPRTPTTWTYSVVERDDPEELPRKVLREGAWVEAPAWEFVQEIDAADPSKHPKWFDINQARQKIAAYGFWLVEVETATLESSPVPDRAYLPPLFGKSRWALGESPQDTRGQSGSPGTGG